MTAPSKRRRGVALLETILALSLIAVVFAGFFLAINQYADRTRVAHASEKLAAVASAAETYLKTHTEELLERTRTGALVVPVGRILPGDSIPVGPAGPSDTLKSIQGAGYLPLSFVDVNAFGQHHAVIVRQPQADRLEAMVVTVGGRDIPDAMMGQAASDFGASGGFVPASSNRILGSGGGWAAPVSAWTATTPSGTVGPTEGHIAAAMALDEDVVVADYMYRRNVGIPEANQMHVDLSMGNSDTPGDQRKNVTDAMSLRSKDGVRSIDMGTSSYLVMANGVSGVAMARDGTTTFSGDVGITRDLRGGRDLLVDGSPGRGSIMVGGEIGTGRDVQASLDVSASSAVRGVDAAAGRDVSAVGTSDPNKGDVTSDTAVKATVDASAGQDATSGRNVKGHKLFDLDSDAFSMDPSEKSTMNDVSADNLDVDALGYGTPGLRSAEKVGMAASRLWPCRIDYRATRGGYGTWVEGPYFNGTSQTTPMSSPPPIQLIEGETDECEGCGIQTRLVCGPTNPTPQECPAGSTLPYPQCLPPEVRVCPAGTSGTWPNCVGFPDPPSCKIVDRTSPINIALIWDGSGSIAASYAQEVQAIQNTIDLMRAKFPKSQDRISIKLIQFATGALEHTTVRLNDPSLSNVASLGMAQFMNGMTNYAAAFHYANQFFAQNAYADAKNFVLFVSDGNPNQGNSAQLLAQMRASSYITAVGFGGATKSVLDQVDNTFGANIVSDASQVGDIFSVSPVFECIGDPLPPCPAGYTGEYPNCVPPPCPANYSGTYPNCVPIPCPTGYTGAYPNCVPPPCPTGYSGIYPACVPPPCPAGYTGTYPSCVAPACPAGQIGTYPNCSVPTCPANYTGTYPACVAPVCPSGTLGTYPNCLPTAQYWWSWRATLAGKGATAGEDYRTRGECRNAALGTTSFGWGGDPNDPNWSPAGTLYDAPGFTYRIRCDAVLAPTMDQVRFCYPGLSDADVTTIRNTARTNFYTTGATPRFRPGAGQFNPYCH